ncbi:MAG: protein translocase subunit SecD [Actinomycetota bacterium]|nr:protein translocase subunit SecD [Actinomycetota bacterium]
MVRRGKGSRLAVLVTCLAVVAGMWATILTLGWGPRLGLDLQGGVSLTLLPERGQGAVDQAVLDQTVEVIRQRIDALGVAEPEIARQGDTVIVQLPGVADREQAEDVIGRTARLAFRPVLAVIPPGSPAYRRAGPPCGELLQAQPPDDEPVVLCERGVAEAGAGDGVRELPPRRWNKLRLGPVALTGSGVTDARAAVDEAGLSWRVDLDLNARAAQGFAAVTGRLACFPLNSPRRQLGIVLDNIVESAPPMAASVRCDEGITGGRATIETGGEEEARELALVLRTGALPISLEIEQSQGVSPTLGRSSLRAGLAAGFLGLALVAAYLMFLYRGIGLAAIAELAMFGLVTLGLVIVLGNTAGFTLTLAGIAGIIVSVGIAADSSIIYRERYRDEVRAGRTVRSAADHAYRRSFRTNLTGNTVSLLAAAVLYFLAVGPVRGFAFTLGLSTLIDTLLLATFTRSLFGLLANEPRLARSPLMGLRADVVAPTVDGQPPRRASGSVAGGKGSSA